MTRATRSRTSLAAASTSRLTSNSMRTCERSSSLSDSILRMPSMPATESSMICVILVSMIAADAPRYAVVIETVGRSMSGYSRTDRRWSDTRPKITSSRLMTVAKTGRRTESSEIRMPSARAAGARSLRTTLPSRTFCVPSTTTRSCSRTPSTISTSPGRRLPVAPRAARRRCRARRTRTRGPLRHDRLFGHEQRRRRPRPAATPS